MKGYSLFMECKRCGNKDINYFYKGSKGYYCRKCVKFSRLLIEEDLKPFDYDVSVGVEEYSFDYKLTPKQALASKICANTIDYIVKGFVGRFVVHVGNR